MQTIPAPYAMRYNTPWAEYADGTWRLASQGTDYFSPASTWVRAGRAWAKRHDCESRFFIESAGTVVRLVITPRAKVAPPAQAPQHPGTGAAARAEWEKMTAVFMSPDPAQAP